MRPDRLVARLGAEQGRVAERVETTHEVRRAILADAIEVVRAEVE